jgi:Ca-activated chloride channel family protein
VCAGDREGGGTFALTIVPPSTAALAARPRDVVLVIDRSGSMQGWKMVAARRAAARMIDTLTSRDRFCAIAFDNGLDPLPSSALVDATDRNRFRAVEGLSRIGARGGTELLQPLRFALGLLAGGTAERERVIVLVTDGQVGNEDQIVREVAPTLRNIKMFTLGIDQAVNAAFLRRLASAGGGLCELVESEDRLDAVMTKVHRRIGAPIATELALRATGLEIDRGSIAPAKLPDVYAGAPVVILGRYRGALPAGAAIAVEGTSLGEPLRMTVSASSPGSANEAGSWLAASWARAHIRDLEDRYAAGARELEGEIVRISKQFSVLSRFTAFIAIDRSQVVNESGALRQIVQPVELPAGWDTNFAGASGGPMRTGGHGPPGAMPMQAYGGLSLAPAAMAPSAKSSVVEHLRRLQTPSAQPPARPLAASVPPSSASLPSAPPLEQALREALASPTVDAAYLASLLVHARELAARANPVDATAIRLVRERLVQWIEDLRSIGGGAELASVVEELVARLTLALAHPATLAAEVQAIAARLEALAVGALRKHKSRPAFWK